MEPAYVHWVVQRNAKTAALTTFKSFTDYSSAEAHKAQLENRGDTREVGIEVTIETLPVGEFPGLGQHPGTGTGRSAQRG